MTLLALATHQFVFLCDLDFHLQFSFRSFCNPQFWYTQPEKELREARGEICFDKLIFTKPRLSRNLYEMLRDRRIVLQPEPVQALT